VGYLCNNTVYFEGSSRKVRLQCRSLKGKLALPREPWPSNQDVEGFAIRLHSNLGRIHKPEQVVEDKVATLLFANELEGLDEALWWIVIGLEDGH